jgi:hypothetical protein
MKSCIDFAQAAMASAQQLQEQLQNRTRDPAPQYQPGDRVWLDMQNIWVDPAQKKKLSERYQQFSVVKAIGQNAYQLDTPQGIHNVFHTTLLLPVAHNPLPSQVQDDYQPPPMIVNGEEEYEIERIQDVRVVLM